MRMHGDTGCDIDGTQDDVDEQYGNPDGKRGIQKQYFDNGMYSQYFKFTSN